MLRLTRRVLLAATAASLAAVAAATATYLHDTKATGGPLTISSFPGLGSDAAYVGTVYNFGVQLRVDGDQPIRLVSATLADVPDDVEVVEPLLGYNCGVHREVPTYDVGADLTKTRVNIDLSPLGARSLLPSGQRYCYYVLFRLKPTALGDRVASGARIRYRAGHTTYTHRFELAITLRVNGTGPDPEDIYDPFVDRPTPTSATSARSSAGA